VKPEIILPYAPGAHNADLEKTNARLTASQSYKDLSTVIVTPTRGGRSLTPRWVSGAMGLMRAMNQKCYGPIFVKGAEVGEAFNLAVEMILGNPELRKFKFMLTYEDDNVPPPDGLLKLYENIRHFDVLGGLYFTKGEGGQPMLYGDPNVQPLNFVPQKVQTGQIQRVNGTGMGFTLFKLSAFTKVEKPWFKTEQSYDPAKGAKGYTQDLYFYEKLVRAGGKVAVDNRVKVGHYDSDTETVW